MSMKWTRKQLIQNIDNMIDEHQKAVAYYSKRIDTTQEATEENKRAWKDHEQVCGQLSLLMEIRYHL